MLDMLKDAGSTGEDRKVHVALIDDQRSVREGLSMLIEGTGAFRCTGAFRSMEEALEEIPDDVPDIALVDLGLPGMSGTDGIRILRERYPDLTMLVLTVYDDDERIFDALCAGANGYLLKKTPPSALLDSLHEAVNGGAPMSPEIAKRVITLFRRVRPPAQSDCDLTPHEVRVLKLLAEGHNRATAAGELGVSVNTVSFHLKAVYSKLQVHSQSAAVAKAMRSGLID